MITFFFKQYLRFKPFFNKISKDNIFAIAGQSAFFLVLSAVPFLIFIVSMLQNFRIPVEYIEQGLKTVFSQEAVSYISNFLEDAYSNSVGISLASIIATLWSAAKGIQAITNGLNRIHGTYENRNWLVLRLRSMVYTVVLFVIIVATLLLVVLGSTLNKWLSPYFEQVPVIFGLIYSLRYLIIFLYLVLLFCLLYRNLPNLSRTVRKDYSIKSQFPGAFLCTILWFAVSFGIAVYVNSFNGFSIYGSLTSLAIIMFWFYFCMVSLMLCAEFNFFYHEEIKNFALSRKNKIK